MINFTTTITRVRVYDTDELKDAIKEVDWILVASRGNLEINTATMTTFAEPKADSFTPFQDVTQEQLLSWIEASPEYKTAKAYLETELAQKLAQQTLKPSPLPWEITVQPQ
jgi:hypothetical protein